MIGLKMLDGELQFNEKVEGVDEFIQRVVNTIKIFAIECYYNENLGLDIRVINGVDDAKYKLEHIKEKLFQLFNDELDELTYELISEKNRVITAKFYFTHKKYNKFDEGVELKYE